MLLTKERIDSVFSENTEIHFSHPEKDPPDLNASLSLPIMRSMVSMLFLSAPMAAAFVEASSPISIILSARLSHLFCGRISSDAG